MLSIKSWQRKLNQIKFKNFTAKKFSFSLSTSHQISIMSFYCVEFHDDTIKLSVYYIVYRFCIRLNISPQNPNCFALHLHLMKTENDECLEWPFSGRISITMVNQYDPELTQRDTMMSNSSLMAFRRPTAEICLRGFGYTEYAVVSEVMRNGFVKNDTLIIRVQIKCV